MKKTLKSSIAVTLIFAFLLSACKETPREQIRSSTIPSSKISDEISEQNISDISESVSSENPIRLVTHDVEFSDRTTGNENGYYYLEKGDGVSANLRYIDYASGQDIFLSSRPEGNHFTPEDESYVSSIAGFGEAFPIGNALYLVRSGAPSYKDLLGQDAMAAIFRMDLNGSQRTQIYTGMANEVLQSTMASDGKSLFWVSQRTEMENDSPIQKRYLVQMDIQTGETKDLSELTNSSWLIGAADGVLIFHSIYAETGTAAGIPEMTHEIFAYSFETEALSVLQTWPQQETASTHVFNNSLVTASLLSRTVLVRELSSEQNLVTYQFPDSVSEDLSGFWFETCRDGRYAFWDYSAEQLHVLNLSTGEWNSVTLTYDDPDKLELRPVEIYAENTTQFLVCYDKEIVERHYSNLEGTISTLQRTQPCFALIDKEDYWNSIPNYQVIVFNE